jgi:hypothetical protein
MDTSIRAIKNKPRKVGRPRTTGTGEQVVVRMHEPMLGTIDKWAAKQDDKPGRPEAIRRLVQLGLAASAPAATNNALKPKRKRTS